MLFIPLCKTLYLGVIILVLGDGCWLLSLYKTLLLEEIILCMRIKLILLTISAFNGRAFIIMKRSHNSRQIATCKTSSSPHFLC